MFKEKYGCASYEVLKFLRNTKEDYIKNIPREFIEFLNYNVTKSDSNDKNKFYDNKFNLSKEAKDILGVIYINWLCPKDEKENYIKRLIKIDN